MKQKLFRLLSMLSLFVLYCSTAGAADPITVGRTLEFSSTPTEYTILSNDNVTVTLDDGKGSTGKGKSLYYKTNNSTTINAVCYRSQYNSSTITAFNENVYCGYKVGIVV